MSQLEIPRLQHISWPSSLNSGHPIASTTCVVVSGSHPFSFRWFKDGKELSQVRDDRIIVRNEPEFSQLEIRKIRASDRGNYSCSVSNPSGSDSQSAVLDIKGTVTKLIT